MPGAISHHSIVRSKQAINDPQGSNPKPRRFVVYQILEHSNQFYGVAISSKYERSNPYHIKLPMNHKTGLVVDCGAICDNWFGIYDLNDFERIGHCPVKEMTLIHQALMKLAHEPDA